MLLNPYQNRAIVSVNVCLAGVVATGQESTPGDWILTECDRLHIQNRCQNRSLCCTFFLFLFLFFNFKFYTFGLYSLFLFYTLSSNVRNRCISLMSYIKYLNIITDSQFWMRKPDERKPDECENQMILYIWYSKFHWNSLRYSQDMWTWWVFIYYNIHLKRVAIITIIDGLIFSRREDPLRRCASWTSSRKEQKAIFIDHATLLYVGVSRAKFF